jgi:hypothetical protein
VQADEPRHHGLGVVRRAADARAHQLRRLAHALEAHLLLAVLDDHPPGLLVAARHHAAEVHVGAGQRLELERDVLKDMRQARAALEPLD